MEIGQTQHQVPVCIYKIFGITRTTLPISILSSLKHIRVLLQWCDPPISRQGSYYEAKSGAVLFGNGDEFVGNNGQAKIGSARQLYAQTGDRGGFFAINSKKPQLEHAKLARVAATYSHCSAEATTSLHACQAEWGNHMKSCQRRRLSLM